VLCTSILHRELETPKQFPDEGGIVTVVLSSYVMTIVLIRDLVVD